MENRREKGEREGGRGRKGEREREGGGWLEEVGGAMWRGKGRVAPSDFFISFEIETLILVATMNNTYISH